jgi:Zn-finger nucleic acid-binding protein
MKCPRCETTPLEERQREGLTVDVCLGCRGIWLDRGELERLIARAVEEQDAVASHGRARPPGHDDDMPWRSGRHEHDADRHHGKHEHHGDREYRGGHYRKRRWYEALGNIFD